MADAKALSLLDTSDVHEAMGSDPKLLAQVTPSFESAITRATIKLQTVLDTSLKPLSNTDIFRVETWNPVPLDGLMKLRLRNGLVRRDQPITITWASEVDGDYESIDNTVVDYEKGFVRVPQWTPQGRYSSLSFYRAQAKVVMPFYVKVQYASGLIEGVDKVDDWENLRQAILCFVPGFIMSTAEASAASPKIMYAVMAKQKLQSDAADDMLRDYMRTLAPHIRPLSHEQSTLQLP
jgi:hypothetical protein